MKTFYILFSLVLVTFTSLNLSAFVKPDMATLDPKSGVEMPSIFKKGQAKVPKFLERIVLRRAKKKAKKQLDTPRSEQSIESIKTICLLAMLFGIGAFLLTLLIGILAGVFAVAALILGIIGRQQAKENGMKQEKGMAIAGLILGIIYLGLVVLLLGLLILIFLALR